MDLFPSNVLDYFPAVRNDLIRVDLLIPTLSSVHQATSDRIHRPSPGLTISSLMRDFIAFREIFSRQIWLEIFLVPPLNTTEEELSALRHAIREVKPDRIQLNMPGRPGTEFSSFLLMLLELKE